jgi:hypothetical protein
VRYEVDDRHLHHRLFPLWPVPALHRERRADDSLLLMVLTVDEANPKTRPENR